LETIRRPRHGVALSITTVASALAIILVGCGGSPATPSASTLSGSGPSASPIAAATVVPTAAPSVAISPAGPVVFDTRTIADKFALPMKVTLPVGWKPGSDIKGTLGLLYTGSPEGPDSDWWGPDILLADEARIHDPSDAVSSDPATPDQKRFMAWPADFFGYITGLPGVTVVSGPEPVTIGGVTGKQIVVKTPSMHPLVWMNGDYSWIGGGQTGVDSATERRFIVLETGGHKLFITLANDPSTFEARDTELRAILDTISFE
jgi:hypothetical protein